jgi:hypothetical protein
MATNFISYARADDEEFANCDLTAQGIEAWWDEESMRLRGRPFALRFE